jgi:hypothetical protein
MMTLGLWALAKSKEPPRKTSIVLNLRSAPSVTTCLESINDFDLIQNFVLQEFQGIYERKPPEYQTVEVHHLVPRIS